MKSDDILQRDITVFLCHKNSLDIVAQTSLENISKLQKNIDLIFFF